MKLKTILKDVCLCKVSMARAASVGMEAANPLFPKFRRTLSREKHR